MKSSLIAVLNLTPERISVSVGITVVSTSTLGATVRIRHGGLSISGTLAKMPVSVSGIRISVSRAVVSGGVSVSGMAIVSTVVVSGIGISLGFGISRAFVDLVDAIGGSRSGHVLVAGGSGIIGAVGSIGIGTVGIRITVVSTEVAGVQVGGIGLGISLGFGISGTLAVMVTVSAIR